MVRNRADRSWPVSDRQTKAQVDPKPTIGLTHTVRRLDEFRELGRGLVRGDSRRRKQSHERPARLTQRTRRCTATRAKNISILARVSGEGRQFPARTATIAP